MTQIFHAIPNALKSYTMQVIQVWMLFHAIPNALKSYTMQVIQVWMLKLISKQTRDNKGKVKSNFATSCLSFKGAILTCASFKSEE